jgi:predicted nucleotidyltransferase
MTARELPLEWDLALRDALGTRVTRVLEADPRVSSLELTGSLARGGADIYSDVDLIAHLEPGIVDRDFFFDLPAVMDAVGPRVIDGWGFAALPRHYVGTYYFPSLPLFWHVDIDCAPAAVEWHVDATDLFDVKRWEQRFKMWIEAVQRLLRVEKYGSAEKQQNFEAYLADMKMRIAKRMDLSSVAGTPREQLSRLLELEAAWHRAQGLGDEGVFAACDSLRREVLH